MRQGNGTDVLGLNDPRNASIGVIYVSANDENATVINAIQSQAKLGRKQVAVVLSEQRKAFQHPEDFDELKRLRNSSQIQVVFIAPGGQGPAEFARQRRFLVYSSLENYTKSLHDEQKSKEVGKGWLFSRRRLTHEPAVPEIAPASSDIQPMPMNEITEEKDSKAPISRIRPIIIGGAEVIASPDTTRRENSVVLVASPQHETMDAGEEADEHVSGPAIIDLGSTRVQKEKETAKLADVEEVPAILPVAVGGTPIHTPDSQRVQPVASASPNHASRQSGKVAAVGATPGSSGANRARARKSASGLAATSLASTATGSTPPPTINRGGSGGGGGGGGRRGAVILGLVALVVLTAGVVSAIAYSQPGLLGSVKSIVKLQNQSTVTITPASKTENDSYIVVGVSGTPDASKQQISARTLTGTSPSQSRTVAATGQKQTPGVQATGTLTFTNGKGVQQTIAAGQVFTGKDGIKVASDAAATIPSANLGTGVLGRKTVAAHAIQVGQSGNINTSDIAGYCCTGDNTIFVQNGAFSGGQDPQNYTFVQQSDINGVVNALEPSLLQQAQNNLKGQIHSNEQLAGSVTCSPSIKQSQNAGDKASSVTVTVSASCSGVAYDQKGALSLVTNLLSKKATTDLGSGYALTGSIVTTSKVQTSTQSGVTLLVSAKGVWVYQLTASVQQNLKNLIAGKSVADATTLLKSQPGISDVSINPNSGTLPTNVNDITISVVPVAGLSGGGTSTGGGGTSVTPTVTGPGAGPTTQPGNG